LLRSHSSCFCVQTGGSKTKFHLAFIRCCRSWAKHSCGKMSVCFQPFLFGEQVHQGEWDCFTFVLHYWSWVINQLGASTRFVVMPSYSSCCHQEPKWHQEQSGTRSKGQNHAMPQASLAPVKLCRSGTCFSFTAYAQICNAQLRTIRTGLSPEEHRVYSLCEVARSERKNMWP